MNKKKISIFIICIFLVIFCTIAFTHLDVKATNVVEINDEVLRTAILNTLGYDETHVITVNDMESLDYLSVYNAKDLSPLSYATNLEMLIIQSKDPTTYDLSFMQNLNLLGEVWFNHVGGIQNIEVINSLPNLFFIEFAFENESYITANLSELFKIDRSNLNLSINSNSDLETDRPEDLIDDIKTINVNRIYFKEMYKNIHIQEPLELGGEKTYTFNEINPWIGEYILNPDSIFYNGVFLLTSDSDNIVVDNENKTITINTNGITEPGYCSGYLRYIYEIDFDAINDSTYGTTPGSFVLSFQVINQGGTDVVYIADRNLRQLLLDYYDIDNDGKITEIDMNNITSLYLLNIASYVGIDKAVNLEDLTIEDTFDTTNFSCYYLRNMNNFKELIIKNYGKLTYLYKLNDLPNLKLLDFTSKSTDIYNDLKNIRGLNNTILKLTLKDIEDLDIDEFASLLENVEVKNIYFTNLYEDVTISEPIKIGKQKTFTFDEINPFFNKYMLNRNSIHYNEDFELYAKSSNVIVDNDKKTITIKSQEGDNPGDQTVDVMYWYYIDGYYPDHEFKLAYTLSEDGVYDEEYTLGDINNDGLKNITDSNLILKYMKGMTEFDENQILAGDLNKDGFVNVTDYTVYIKYLKGIEEL